MTISVLPQGILFDFDGIIIHTREIPDWNHHIAQRIASSLEGLRGAEQPTAENIAVDLVNTCRAVSHWANSTSLETHPHELPDEKWIEYLTVDWPLEFREQMYRDARKIVCQISANRYERVLREGIAELLEYLSKRGIPMAIVSNTPCGEVTRVFLRDAGLSHYFRAEIYSDEVGLRKPNPDIIQIGAKALALEPDQTWFVGDRLDRDITCGFRAGVAKTVLMESNDTSLYPYELSVVPDIEVKNPQELLKVLQETYASSISVGS